MAEALTTQEQLVRVTLRIFCPLLLVPGAFYWEHTSSRTPSFSLAIYPHSFPPWVSVDGGVMWWTRQLLARSFAPSPSRLTPV